ncbi:hypothetical protein SPONN_1547 [uncultured Candidatus Thioglobus sp.]|nr:hypothetical protein SPONN_1547 [uncultured Candidatus Thioglobus sp.]
MDEDAGHQYAQYPTGKPPNGPPYEEEHPSVGDSPRVSDAENCSEYGTEYGFEGDVQYEVEMEGDTDTD